MPAAIAAFVGLILTLLAGGLVVSVEPFEPFAPKEQPWVGWQGAMAWELL